jgi:hypothetical protein
VVVDLGSVGPHKFELAVQLNEDATDWDDFRAIDAIGNLVVVTGPIGLAIEEQLNERKLEAFGIREKLEQQKEAADEARAEERFESRRSA